MKSPCPRGLAILAIAIVAMTIPIRLASQTTEGSSRIETLRTYEIQRTDTPVKVDGALDDDAWKGLVPMRFLVETFPSDNVAPPVRTEGFVTYDDNNLYVGIRSFDTDPSQIRAHLTDRDHAFDDDFVGIVIDTFNDERRAFEFFVNPLGVQMDLFQNDVGGNEDETWDAIWDSAGKITEDGYVVEMAIPFSSLRFDRVDGPRTWGVDMIRIYPRSQRHRLAINPLERGKNCYVCQFAKMTGLDGITPGLNIEVDPTVTSRRTDVRNESGGIDSGSFDTDPGLTARWGMTPNLTLNAALNPDFSQVEADSAQLDVNNQFTLFFNEKRPFFLEGADFFETPLNVVYTRTVADPDWGIKMSGKEGKSAIGVYVARDTVTNVILPGAETSRLSTIPGENVASVFRYRHDVGQSSTLGFLATSRVGQDGYNNSVAGFDGYFRASKHDTITTQLLGSRTEYPDGIAQAGRSLSDPALKVLYRHDSKNWFWNAIYEDVGEDFRADAGFMPRVDYRRTIGSVEHTWWPDDDKKTWYTRFSAGVGSSRTEKQNGDLLERFTDTWFGIKGPMQSYLYVDGGVRERTFRGRSFDENFVEIFGEVRPSGSIYVNLNVVIDDQIDFANARPGERLKLDPFVRWNVGRRTELQLEHAWERLDVDGGRLYDAHLSELRAVYQLNLRTFVRAIVQYTTVDRNVSLYTVPVEEKSEHLFPQLLLSYKLNPQTVLFAGYTENRIGDESIDLAQQDRTFFVKLGYALLF